MYISELAQRINHKLAGDTRSQTEIIGYMDAVIDDINSKLNAKFPTYTEAIRKELFPTPKPPKQKPCPPKHCTCAPPPNPMPPQVPPFWGKKQNPNWPPFNPAPCVPHVCTCGFKPDCGHDHSDLPPAPPPDTPAISDSGFLAGASNIEYTAIPDKYQRSVVIVGAAIKIYEADEEGNQSAQMFRQEYDDALFYMLRDFSFKIPKCYREDDQGFVALSDEDIESPGMRVPNDPFLKETGFR